MRLSVFMIQDNYLEREDRKFFPFFIAESVDEGMTRTTGRRGEGAMGRGGGRLARKGGAISESPFFI